MSAVSNSSKNKLLASSQLAAPALSAANLRQPGFLLTLAVFAAAILAMISVLLAALEWRNFPFFGAMLTPYMVVDGSQSINSRPWPGLEAGLQWRDHIIAINGQPLAETPGDYASARENFRRIMIGLESKSRVTVDFVRRVAADGDPRSTAGMRCGPVENGTAYCQVSYWVSRLPDTDFLTYFVIPFVLGVATLITGLVVLLLRPNQAPARVIALFCALMGIFMASNFDVNNTYVLVPFRLVAIAGLSGSIATLALLFPLRSGLLYHFPALQVVPALISGLLAVAVLVHYFNPPDALSFPATWQSGIIAAMLALVFLAVALLRRRSRAASATIRDQCNTVLIGIALIAGPAALWALNALIMGATGESLLGFNASAFMPFFIMPSLSMAYAVLQYRTIDTDRVISQGITYFIMLAALIAGYFLLVLGSSLITREALRQRASDPLLIALTVFGMATLFLPVRTLVQSRIDRIYFRTRANYQERVEAFARLLTPLTELSQIIEAYQNQLKESIAPASVFVFLPDHDTGDFVCFGKPRPATDIRFEASSSLVRLLNDPQQPSLIYFEPGQPWPEAMRAERARLAILKTSVVVRLSGGKNLIGFVCIGTPLSGSGAYEFEQLRFIENLTSQIAVAVERAQAFEAQERRVRELNVLSQVSQAVNFTLEFDDLLELINAQTERLVEAPHFYIVLREQQTDKLYFAFFLEDYERYRDKENRRWLMGRDLFSQVVRSGTALRVNNYARAMAQRNSAIIYEDPNLQAWMGVPLIAGANTLGVMAVGTTANDKTYSDDQLRILGDIASLAATSLEKARLFAETNLRARQLSALNEISRQLASELHVENLLELITESAVNILDAEAGSLLLTVEDDKDSLEFKVAVGSSGQELIGKRFPIKRGLVGEVAFTGKPVIVNDAANDPRWGGEVAKGEFSTTAVLAVPLIAQNRVIGVLEVLNKKNGGIYVQEDADLLTTFAGQAAVAIENARLFEMTDLQLAQRLEELQALERIDVELNRSLDLKRVAEITMRWAIANSGASAGALGLVTGDPPYLEIVASYGYGDQDKPVGADGAIWPLDRGIVRRVMRTRQPDLAPDVSIDPDYEPILRGSLCQLTIPMLSGGEINALLILEKDREPRLNLLDLAFAQRLAEHASIAITNAQLVSELARANEGKSEFVSFVAHELKTPMTSMKGYTDLLLSGVVGSLSPQQQNFLGTIRSNVERMITLVSDLNDVTKLQTNNMQLELAPVEFRNVVTETLRPLHKQIEDRSQNLTVSVPDNLPLILADQNRLIQVLTNLVTNASKYSPPDSHITISAKVVERNLDAKGRDRGPALHVSVRDTGIGMNAEDLAKLFTPYFRSDNPQAREQPGTGLGLTITQGIIQRHGGDIWVESEMGKGTAFHFSVPLAPEMEKTEPEAIAK